MFYCKTFCVCALVGVLIKWLYCHVHQCSCILSNITRIIHNMYPDWLKNLFIFNHRKWKYFFWHMKVILPLLFNLSTNDEARQNENKARRQTFNSEFMDQSLEKLIFEYLVKKLLAIYGIRLFITTVRSALSYDRSVRSKSTCLIS